MVQIFDNWPPIVLLSSDQTFFLHFNHFQDHSWPVLWLHMSFSRCLLNNLGLVDYGGVGTDQIGAWSGFGPDGAISLLKAACTVSLGHLGAVGLAVLVIRMLLTGRTPQTFIHFILIICHWRVAAAQRWVLVIFGDTSWPWAPVCWDNGTAI